MSGALHYKAQIRKLHTKLLSSSKKDDSGDSDPLLEQLSSTNLPRWSLALLGAPQKEGWLIKKGGIGGALTKRWFVLSGPLLFYFSNETEDARAKGIVPLTGADVVTYEVPEKEQAKYGKKAAKGGFQLGDCWAIKTRVREFVISSESESDRAQWMEACSSNSKLALGDSTDDPKTSREVVQKLLLPPDQLRAEIDSMQSAAHTLPSQPREEDSQVSSREVTSAASAFEGGVVGGWRYDKDGSLKTFDVKTSGTWPFVVDEPGLFINCQYAWDGELLRAEEGSGSKGEWDENTSTFTWSCLPLGSFHAVYAYKWDEVTNEWRPTMCGLEGTKLPIWTYDGLSKLSCSKAGEDFEDLEVEGALPPQIMLAVAMHLWQWKAEGELTLLMQEEDDE